MDFSWDADQTRLKERVVQFAQQELTGAVAAMDRQEEFDRGGWEKCGEFGIHGLPIPKDYGGGGIDPLTTIYALEGLGYGCKDNGLIFSIHAHMWGCEIPILAFGTEAQKQQYLPRLCRGKLIGAHAVSESGSGSDAYGLATTAEKKGNKYLLSGGKIFVTNGPVADVVVVFATLDRAKGARAITAFLVERDFPGFSVTRKVEKMGLRTAAMGELALENCAVPAENRLGQEGAGIAIFTRSMEWERSCIVASAVGAMERQLENCIRYARQRRQFGKPIGKFQLVASKIVDMKTRLETAKTLLYKVGWLKKEGRSVLMEASLAKLYISESWVQSCLDAIQIHGGYGYLTEFEVERELRDALGSRLYSGTSEIQRLIIGQCLGL